MSEPVQEKQSVSVGDATGTILRQVAFGIASLLAAKGVIGNSEIEIVVGILIGLGSLGFSIWNKYHKNKQINKALYQEPPK